MSSLMERIVPPVSRVDDDGRVRPSRQEHQEQVATVALGAANLLACIGLAVALPSLDASAQARTTKLVLLGGAALASVMCLPAARHGNRLIAGLVVLAAGFLGPGAILSPLYVIPHYGLSMWMILRQNRLVKVQAEEKRKARLAGAPSPGRGPSDRRSRGRRGAPKMPDGRAVPNASKRYTPPRPKKRPVPVDPKAADKTDSKAGSSTGQ